MENKQYILPLNATERLTKPAEKIVEIRTPRKTPKWTQKKDSDGDWIIRKGK